MKMKNMVVLLCAMVATLVLAFSVSLFAKDRVPSDVAPECAPGSEALRVPSGKFTCVPSPRNVAMPVQYGQPCHSDSDCHVDEICVSCTSFTHATEAQCPPGEAICSQGMPQQ